MLLGIYSHTDQFVSKSMETRSPPRWCDHISTNHLHCVNSITVLSELLICFDNVKQKKQLKKSLRNKNEFCTQNFFTPHLSNNNSILYTKSLSTAESSDYDNQLVFNGRFSFVIAFIQQMGKNDFNLFNFWKIIRYSVSHGNCLSEVFQIAV